MSHEAQGNVSGAQPRWVAEQSTADTHGVTTQCKGSDCLCCNQTPAQCASVCWRKQPRGVFMGVLRMLTLLTKSHRQRANETQIMIQVFKRKERKKERKEERKKTEKNENSKRESVLSETLGFSDSRGLELASSCS